VKKNKKSLWGLGPKFDFNSPDLWKLIRVCRAVHGDEKILVIAQTVNEKMKFEKKIFGAF